MLTAYNSSINDTEDTMFAEAYMQKWEAKSGKMCLHLQHRHIIVLEYKSRTIDTSVFFKFTQSNSHHNCGV